MITIDANLCIGCGKCIEDCFTQEIELYEGKVRPKEALCLECGHCVAICPVNAVTVKNYSNEDIICVSEEDRLDPAQLLRWMKTRRTIRKFTSEKISPENLEMILSMGRYSPKGGNIQNVSYIVLQDNIDHAKRLAIDSLYQLSDLSEEMKKQPNMIRYAKNWKKMYEEKDLPNAPDRLFFGAQCAILMASPSPINACIAAAHMETMVYSLSLGMLYCGFMSRAVNHSQELKEFLGLNELDTVQATLAIGHPAVKYERSAPRNIPKINYR